MGVVKLVIQIWPNASTTLKNKLIKGFQKAKLSEDAIESIADNCGISTAVQLLQSTLPTTIKSTIHKLKTMNCIIYILLYTIMYIGCPTNNLDADKVILSLDIMNCTELDLSSIYIVIINRFMFYF